MTRNDKIAEIMGWGKDSHELHILDEFNDEPEANRLAITKLLQARMVADGWIVEITNYIAAPFFCAMALHGKGGVGRTIAEADTEPAALHALFCKVFSIEGEG